MSGTAEVTNPENARPIHGPLPEGPISVKVLEVKNENPNSCYGEVDADGNFKNPETVNASEHWEVTCEYPGERIKGHQVHKGKDVGAIVPLIRNTLRGSHGTPKAKATPGDSHRLNHIAGDLETVLPATIEGLAGMTLTFKHA